MSGSFQECLTWRLGSDRFALPLARCKEVQESVRIYPTPRARGYILGIANLRGEVVAVLDLQRLFHHNAAKRNAPREFNECRRHLVRLRSQQGSVAVTADQLTDILRIPEVDIDPPPQNFTELQSALTSGVARHEQDTLLLLNADAFFTARQDVTH